MPEYLAPGVYVEETSFRSSTIEGVSTSTAGFIGPTGFGPTRDVPELLTSLADYQRIYGGLDPLQFSDGTMINYLAQAVRSFFEEGGQLLYVMRVADPSATQAHGAISFGSPPFTINLNARYPGFAGNMNVQFTFRIGPNVLVQAPSDPGVSVAASNPPAPINTLRGVNQYDVVLVTQNTSPPSGQSAAGTLYTVEPYFNTTAQRSSFRLHDMADATIDVANLIPITPTNSIGDTVRVVTVNVTVTPPGLYAQPLTWQNLSFHPNHPNGLPYIFAPQATASRATSLYVPMEFQTGLPNPDPVYGDGALIAYTLLNQPTLPDNTKTVLEQLNVVNSTDLSRTFQVQLLGGMDGLRPTAAAYEGDEGLTDGLKSGLCAFEDLDDISIVAAPGSTYGYDNPDTSYQNDSATIQRLLITHCETMRYRVAVLDSANGYIVSQVSSYRGQLDSEYAALYYPWITLLDPITNQLINVPPSGSVAGIYARSDANIGVHKAPANEVVNLALGFEFRINKAQQDVLNPQGINCFRFFEGRGFRLWGARTISSDPDWIYINVRRYFAYLEHSIDKGTQWVVFMPNGPALWANVVQTVEDFLFNEWQSGRLLGDKPSQAYFVRCDRTTMTQSDLDNGRLICLIGVAPIKPAEFVIFRIGQWTGSSQS